MLKLARSLWSGLVLFIGVILAASVLSCFILVVAVPIGAAMAIQGSLYWQHVWIGFDKLYNAILAGDHRETISSRLGKSTLFGNPPVFKYLWIDKLVSWWLHQVDHNHVYKSIDWTVGNEDTTV